MSVTISSEKRVTAKDILAEAETIRGKCEKRFTKKDTPESLADLHSEMLSEHKDFAQAYPIVLRYMCELKLYHTKVMRKFLEIVEKKPWQTEDEFFKAQAMYVAMLYRAENPHCGKKAKETIYNNTLKMLQLERDGFKQQMDETKGVVDADHKRMMRQNREELKNWFSTYGMEAVDVKIQVDAGELAGDPVHVPDVELSDDECNAPCFSDLRS